MPGAGLAGRDAMFAHARALAAAGVTAITYEKSTTRYSALTRDYARLARDTVAAADWLAAMPGVDPVRIGVLGFSEGGCR